jgi:hypothetical protein
MITFFKGPLMFIWNTPYDKIAITVEGYRVTLADCPDPGIILVPDTHIFPGRFIAYIPE